MADSMSREEWQRIGEILDGVLDAEPERRAAIAADLCGANERLRDGVLALLAAGEEGHSFLDDGADPYTILLLDDSDTAGQRIGPFRVVRRIARGGMGAVYLAERVDGEFEQRVAIKLVRAELEGELNHQRIREERRILARLEHPNIARLVDGGVTDDGQPYFAMEYVEGTPIARYCDEHALSVRERLDLIQSVCHAVHFAHRNLVVHRDLKPANILVTADGHVKLLDFGIAKLLVEGAAQEGTRLQAMTPEYAAPEQIRGEPVTTTTDVYALGVVIYELLSAERPYRLEDRTPAEIEMLVCKRQPDPPSVASQRSRFASVAAADAAERVARARRTTPARLRRQLTGDLDTIVMRALAKEPDRRYVSAEALAQDVRRHVAGLPIDARRDSVVYRTRKFVFRHRVGVAAAAGLILALFGGLAGTIWQANRAEREALRARQARDFLVGVFQGADPDVSEGREITARELLDAGALRVQQQLAGDPALQAEMLLVMADVFHSLGLDSEGEPLADRALELRRELFGNEHPATAEAMNARAWFDYHAGDYESAERGLREAVALRRSLLGSRDTALARSLDNLAETLRSRGEFAEAESLAREALVMRRELLGTHPDIATSLNNLAVIVRQTDARAEAEGLVREALAIDSTLRGPDHRATLADRNNLALVLSEKGELDEAESIFRDLLARQQRRYGDGHPNVTTTRNNLAAVLTRGGQYAEAESVYRDVLAWWDERGQGEHPNALTTRANLGQSLQFQGKLEEAEARFRESLAGFRRAFGDAHPNVVLARNNLASTLRMRGAYREAEEHYQQVILEAARIWPGQHPLPALFALGYGRLLEAEARCDGALPLLRGALETFAVAGELQRGSAAEARVILATCLARLGRPHDAEPLLLDAYRALNGLPDRQRIAAERLVTLYESLGRNADAIAYRDSIDLIARR
jgi:serine/threonine-protein kinase